MKRINLKIILLFIFFYIIYSKSVSHANKCLLKNIFQDPKKSIKSIDSPEECTSISKSCCYINLTYNYNYIDIKAEYCIDLTVNISAMKIFLENLYNDDLIYFTNTSAHMFDDYVKFGRNYIQTLANNLSCYNSPRSSTYYSDYSLSNCAVFDDEGSCILLNNQTYFKNFLAKFHEHFSSSYCSKKQENKKCILPQGKRGNPLMARPLLVELISYLKADVDENADTDDDDNIQFDAEEEEDTTGTKYISSWKYDNNTVVNCKNISYVNFTIKCPDDYNQGTYLKNIIFIIPVLGLFLF